MRIKWLERSDEHWDFRRYTFLDSVVLQFIRSNNVVTQKTIYRILSLNAQNGNTLNSLHIDCASLYDSRNVEFTVNVLNKIYTSNLIVVIVKTLNYGTLNKSES